MRINGAVEEYSVYGADDGGKLDLTDQGRDFAGAGDRGNRR